MRSTYAHITARAQQVIAALCICISLSAQGFVADGDLLNAYLQNDMSIWKTYIDTAHVNDHMLAYEYGYCAALMAEDKEAARPYVKRFREHVEAMEKKLPAGHYEMYMSAVYVYELRLHESFHPAKGMSLAKEATQLAPNDPMVLSYYGTCLFYAPRPFGSKREAQQWFDRAEQLFQDEKWHNCWWKPATWMYMAQCYEKQGYIDEAIHRAQEILKTYPDYAYIKYDYIPSLILRTE